MTRFPYDQFAKHCFEPLLTPIGRFTPSLKVNAEVREIDVYFEPFESTSPPSELGLLYRCVAQPTSLEPFRNAVSAHEIRSCSSKLFELHNEIIREAKRLKQRPTAPDQRPFLWVITPTLSKSIQDEFGAVEKLEAWPPGVFFAPKGWCTGFIVVHKLPETPDTLWFRLFGRDNFQARAFAELTKLPFDHPYRAPLMESLANLRVILESRPSRTVDEQALFMQLSPLYLEKIAAAERVGEQRGELRGEQRTVILLLMQKFDVLPNDLVAQIESLNQAQLQSLIAAVLSLSSIADLSDWLNR
jgi:hypothetical protein